MVLEMGFSSIIAGEIKQTQYCRSYTRTSLHDIIMNTEVLCVALNIMIKSNNKIPTHKDRENFKLNKRAEKVTYYREHNMQPLNK